MRPLSDYKMNIYSQFGEDGILKEVLQRISRHTDLNKWCVEFGAWDGVFLSNTCRLIKEDGYSAVLIEGEPERVAELQANHPSDAVIKVCSYVGFAGNETLDKILSETPVPTDFDILSIDIDGCDYHVWSSLKNFKPRIVVIEYNATMPNAVHYVQPADLRVFHGSSAASLVELARQKGYSLVAVTTANLIFVEESFLDAVVGNRRDRLDDLRDDSKSTVYLFSGHDGTILTSRDLILPYHDVLVSARSLQVVPRSIRKWPSNKSLLQKVRSRMFRSRFPRPPHL